MKKEILIIAGIVLLLSVNGYMFYEVRQVKKIVMVDAIKMFNEFKMKTELENMERYKLDGMTRKIDSIEKIIRVMQEAKQNIGKDLIDSYNMSKMLLDDEYNTSNKQINEQVWKRINPMIDKFGEENGYRLIIGANGMGTVLYNEVSVDVTEKAIKYINKRYEDGN